MVPHEVYNKVIPHCKAQWPVEYQRKIEEERYQEQKHNMRTTCVLSPTTIEKNRNRTRGITHVLVALLLSHTSIVALLHLIQKFNKKVILDD